MSTRRLGAPLRLVGAADLEPGDVARLLAEPATALELEPGAARALLGPVAALSAYLAARVGAGSPAQESGPGPDRLLDVAEAAKMLGISRDSLYRRARTLPFTVRPTPGTVRFSLHGIGRYLRQRQGR